MHDGLYGIYSENTKRDSGGMVKMEGDLISREAVLKLLYSIEITE